MEVKAAAIFLLQGLWVTITLTIAASILACAVALLAGIARASVFAWIRIPATLYVEIFRGTSGYVQLFWFFFALPIFGITPSPFVCGSMVLGLNVGSYGSEIVRGALLAVPLAQLEAATALNYSRWQRFRYVVFPQAMRTMLPPAGNLLVDLIKITPLVSAITVGDLTFKSVILRKQGVPTIVIFTLILIVYFCLTSVVAEGVRFLERKLSQGADRMQVDLVPP
jgi:polar amino acid transport system permease protein